MRGMRCVLAAVLAAGIVTVVTAQPGRQGGFGGGFGQQDVTTLVLTNVSLQEELKVTDDQKAKFKPVATKQADLNKKRGEMFGKGGGKGGGGFDKDKMTEMMEEGKKVAEEVKKVVDDTLTSDQKTRLKQIDIQTMGVTVFAEPVEGKGGGGFGGTSEAHKANIKEVADTLKLTEGQKSKIKGILDEYNKDRAAVRKDVFGDTGGGGGKGKGKGGMGGGNQDPEKMKEFTSKSAKLATEAMGKIADSLDGQQKTAWKGLVGEAFDTSKLAPTPPAKKD